MDIIGYYYYLDFFVIYYKIFFQENREKVHNMS